MKSKPTRRLVADLLRKNYKLVLITIAMALVCIVAITVSFVFYIRGANTFASELVYSRVDDSCIANGVAVGNFIASRFDAAESVASAMGMRYLDGDADAYFKDSVRSIEQYVENNIVKSIDFIEKTTVGSAVTYKKLSMSTDGLTVVRTEVPVALHYAEAFGGTSALDFRATDNLISILYPIYKPNDTIPFAVMECLYNNRDFAAIETVALPDGATVYVLDGKGNIVDGKDFSSIGSHAAFNIFDVLSLSEMEDGSSVDTTMSLYKTESEDWTIEFKTADKVWHAVFTNVELADWHVMMVYNTDLLDNEVSRMIGLMWVVEGVTICVFVALLATFLIASIKNLLELTYENKQIQNMFANIPGGGIVVKNDDDLSIVSFNQGFLDLVGEKREDFISKYEGKAINVVMPDDRETVRLAIKGQLEYSNTLEIQYRVKRPDGKIVWMLSQGKLSTNDMTGEEAMFWVAIDISDTKATRDLLARTNEDYISLTNTIPGGVVKIAYNDNLDFQYANTGFYRMVGFTPDIIKSKFAAGLIKLIVPEDRQQTLESIRAQIKVSASVSVEFRIQTDSRQMWVMLRAQKQFDDRGGVLLLSILSDITEMKTSAKLIEREREKYKTIAKLSDDTLFEYTIATDSVSFMGNTLRGGVKYISSFVKNLEANGFVYPKDIPACRKFIQMLHENLELVDAELRVKLDDKEDFCWVAVSATNNGETVVGKLVDITKAKLEAETLKDLARRDALTGLYNKTATETYIDRFLKTAKAGANHALMVIDIDNFKVFNDTMGHLVGDQVLTAISEKALSLFRSTDILGRVGGDEFCFFAKDFGDEQDVLDKANELCMVLSSLNFGEEHRSLTVSVGIAIYGKNGKTYATLFKAADKALYVAKAKGKNISVLA